MDREARMRQVWEQTLGRGVFWYDDFAAVLGPALDTHAEEAVEPYKDRLDELAEKAYRLAEPPLLSSGGPAQVRRLTEGLRELARLASGEA